MLHVHQSREPRRSPIPRCDVAPAASSSRQTACSRSALTANHRPQPKTKAASTNSPSSVRRLNRQRCRHHHSKGRARAVQIARATSTLSTSAHSWTTTLAPLWDQWSAWGQPGSGQHRPPPSARAWSANPSAGNRAGRGHMPAGNRQRGSEHRAVEVDPGPAMRLDLAKRCTGYHNSTLCPGTATSTSTIKGSRNTTYVDQCGRYQGRDGGRARRPSGRRLRRVVRRRSHHVPPILVGWEVGQPIVGLQTDRQLQQRGGLNPPQQATEAHDNSRFARPALRALCVRAPTTTPGTAALALRQRRAARRARRCRRGRRPGRRRRRSTPARRSAPTARPRPTPPPRAGLPKPPPPAPLLTHLGDRPEAKGHQQLGPLLGPGRIDWHLDLAAGLGQVASIFGPL